MEAIQFDKLTAHFSPLATETTVCNMFPIASNNINPIQAAFHPKSICARDQEINLY
jgi:hypothetical protein